MVEALQGKMCQNSLHSGGGRYMYIGAKISEGRGRPPANILMPLERQFDCATTLPLTFLYNETLQQTFRSVCRNCPKDDKFRYFIPILRKSGAA